MGTIFLIGVIILVIWLYAEEQKKSNQTNYQNTEFVKRNCPYCNGTNYHAFVEREVVVPGKTKNRTTLNLNPLKPFTVFNHKEKVARREVSRQISRFVCDDCGKIFD